MVRRKVEARGDGRGGERLLERPASPSIDGVDGICDGGELSPSVSVWSNKQLRRR